MPALLPFPMTPEVAHCKPRPVANRAEHGQRRGLPAPAPSPPPYDNTSSLKQLHDVFGDSDTALITTLLGSSVVATAQSRQELFELLNNAEQVIRTHETELNIAALAGEALLRENHLLRSRHDSLLARVKPGQYHSMRSLGHGMRTSGSFEQHLVPSGPPTPPTEVPPPVTPPRRGHARRLSASPEQIAQLNNQKGELHTRLEKIISDVRGRRVPPLVLRSQLLLTYQGTVNAASESACASKTHLDGIEVGALLRVTTRLVAYRTSPTACSPPSHKPSVH
ncbi:hypothetical protein AURDEDRAFT_185522 [Auricularia subglabra TFB-10046 SS5]|nr:hypothetical protein AURDEDRAFT_185522 [Auricularia subglabra TFB-10046 SS5]